MTDIRCAIDWTEAIKIHTRRSNTFRSGDPKEKLGFDKSTFTRQSNVRIGQSQTKTSDKGSDKVLMLRCMRSKRVGSSSVDPVS